MSQTEEERWLERIWPTLETVMREAGGGAPIPSGTRDRAALDSEIREQALKIRPYLEAKQRLLRLEVMSRNLALAFRSQLGATSRSAEFEAENQKLEALRLELEKELASLQSTYAASLRWLGVLGSLRRELP